MCGGERRLLKLSVKSASLIPWALAQPVADANRGAFLAVSAILAGRQALDEAQAKRLSTRSSPTIPVFLQPRAPCSR